MTQISRQRGLKTLREEETLIVTDIIYYHKASDTGYQMCDSRAA